MLHAHRSSHHSGSDSHTGAHDHHTNTSRDGSATRQTVTQTQSDRDVPKDWKDRCAPTESSWPPCGFPMDPTLPPPPIPPPPSRPTTSHSVLSPLHGANMVSLTQPLHEDTSSSSSITMSDAGLSRRIPVPPSPSPSSRGPSPLTILLTPSEYAGLHLIPTSLERQLAEEVERKGRAEAKKLQQLQTQHDTLQQFNRTHRIPVPPGWHAMLLTGVVHLSLRGNGMGDAAVVALSDTLARHPWTRLHSLNLSDNDVGDVGAEALGRLLHRNRTLVALDVSHNRLGDTGLLALVEPLRMRELYTVEEWWAYRQAVLQRPGASAAERWAASQPTPSWASIPSYQDLYQNWCAAAAAAAAAASAEESASPPPRGLNSHAAATTATLSGGGGGGVSSSGAHVHATGSGSANRNREERGGRTLRGGEGGGRSRSSAAEAAAAAQAPPRKVRPTGPLDHHSVRRAATAAELAAAATTTTAGGAGGGVNGTVMRVPGNTVLEVLHAAHASAVTRDGVAEVLRRFGLHEPQTESEMTAMTAPTSASGAHTSTLSCGVESLPNSAPSSASAFALPTITDASPRRALGGRRLSNSARPASTTQSMGCIAVVNTPERYCVGVRLRSCRVDTFPFERRSEWDEMRALQAQIDEVLLRWGAERAAFEASLLPAVASSTEPAVAAGGGGVG